MRRILMSLTVALALGACAIAADWPQFQGPNANGISPDTGLAKSWPEGGPKELWKVDLDEGFGPAAIQGGKAYFMNRNTADQKETVFCLDLATGKELWKYEYDAPAKKFDFPGTRSTPAVDDKFVYTVGAGGDVTCLDKEGKKVWAKNLLKDFGGGWPNWGVASSPVIYKDWVILSPQGKEVGLVAVAKDTGEPVWKSSSVGAPSYCTPLIAKVGGVEQAVMLTAGGLSGVNLKDGKVLWSFTMGTKATMSQPDAWCCAIPVPSPTDLGDGKFFLTGGYKGHSCIVQVTADGEKFSVKLAKKIDEIGSHLQNAILYKNNLYVNSDDTGLGLVCMDLDGKILWKTEKTPGLGKGNLLIADDMIYAMDGPQNTDGGTIRLIEASPTAYKELGMFKGLAGKLIWAPMALGDGKLIARDRKQMKCWDVRSK